MINVLFAGNDKVFDGMLTCVISILKRTETKEPFRFFIFTMDVSYIKPEYLPVSAEQTAFLDEYVKKYNPGNSVVRIDVTEIYEKELAGCPNEPAYCSPYTMIRLFADLIPEIPDKLLYLDADILLNRDITLLYNTDVEGYEYAAARDHYGKYLLNPHYINAGVLLLNMKVIRENHVFEKARDELRAKKLTFADQSALIRSTSKKKLLPQKFNDQKFLHPHTVVRHFSKRMFWLPYPHKADVKQWYVSKVHEVFGYYQFDDILYEYIYLIRKFEEQNKD